MPRTDTRQGRACLSPSIPTAWYNILPDLPGEPLPPLHPGTMQPVGPPDLAPLFPEALIMQEVSSERWIDIPGQVLDVYQIVAAVAALPSPPAREALGTDPASSASTTSGKACHPGGSHKPNTAVPQAFYNKAAGTSKLDDRDGRRSVGLVARLRVRDVRPRVRSLHGQGQLRAEALPADVLMETWGATVHASPTDRDRAGTQHPGVDHPDSTGSLGIAISEAVEIAAQNDDTHYSLGTVLNHVCTHQTVIGLEAKKQMEAFEDTPDVVVGCVGGGSNYAGLRYPVRGRRAER